MIKNIFLFALVLCLLSAIYSEKNLEPLEKQGAKIRKCVEMLKDLKTSKERMWKACVYLNSNS